MHFHFITAQLALHVTETMHEPVETVIVPYTADRVSGPVLALVFPTRTPLGQTIKGCIIKKACSEASEALIRPTGATARAPTVPMPH
jgi:hypothetical protein